MSLMNNCKSAFSVHIKRTSKFFLSLLKQKHLSFLGGKNQFCLLTENLLREGKKVSYSKKLLIKP